jgi:hypothetical protein
MARRATRNPFVERFGTERVAVVQPCPSEHPVIGPAHLVRSGGVLAGRGKRNSEQMRLGLDCAVEAAFQVGFLGSPRVWLLGQVPHRVGLGQPMDYEPPMLAPSAATWGHDTNFGSFAQFCVVHRHQVMLKAPRLSWEEAAASTPVGTTAYRM